jgi:hypothetical protein
MTTRRSFLKAAAAGVGAVVLDGIDSIAQAAPATPLIDNVAAACRRLAPLGWRQMLLDATNGELDITASDLRGALATPLTHIDRGFPGFGDFASTGTRAIQPGQPDRSLLHHAFASPTVVADRTGGELRGFPTLAEIEAVENYTYGVEPPTLAELRRRAGNRPLAIAVFALHYRNAPDSVHGHHAELCFARTGISRLGTLEPQYDARLRMFVNVDDSRPFDFRVVPRRFAAFLAVQLAGNSAGFGPQDPLDGDEKRQFWVPLHKLFSGPECIAGLDLDVTYSRGLHNEELAEFHRFLDRTGLQNNWRGEVLEHFPFTSRNEMIDSLSTRAAYGSGVLEPRPSPLVMPAQYEGRPLTFPVDGKYTSDVANLQLGSMMVLPGTPTTGPTYLDDAGQDTQRPAPQYINVRHRVLSNGEIDNLNRRPDMLEIIKRGGYQTQHYIDFAGDGWMEAHCPQLESVVADRLPAYCTVSLPDFFPQVTQRELMLWWKHVAPMPVRDALWAIPPLALSQTRIAANIKLPIGFSLDDVTVTAIVSQPSDGPGPVQTPNGPVVRNKVGLPDGSPGLFDPGWDTSMNIWFNDPNRKLEKFMVGYALGSPFIEDAKLCAALGSYWPGVAPDATRSFQPDKIISGISYPWPSIVPLTDQEIGSAPVAGGAFMPWDGVRGPSMRKVGGRWMAAYTDAIRTDYIDLLGTMTAALTARIDTAEYQARIMAMEAVYWALGIHDTLPLNETLRAKADWAVLSFRHAAADETELAEAERVTRGRLSGSPRYRFHVYRWGKQIPDPDDMRIVLVEMREQVILYVDGSTVLLRRETGPWTIGTSLPT